MQQTITTKKGDYSRIVTNPKYKFFDEETCGSAYFNEYNASEREIDVRETLKRQQYRQRKSNIISEFPKKKKPPVLRKSSAVNVSEEVSPKAGET